MPPRRPAGGGRRNPWCRPGHRASPAPMPAPSRHQGPMRRPQRKVPRRDAGAASTRPAASGCRARWCRRARVETSGRPDPGSDHRRPRTGPAATRASRAGPRSPSPTQSRAVGGQRGCPPDVAIESIGVSSSAASCDAVTTDAATGNGKHVGPDTSSPGTTKVTYDTVPPSTGPHFAQPAASNSSNFYTAQDRPKIETLVHNLEHGYTVLWYDVTAGAAKKAELEQLARVANNTEWAKNKFIVSAWDTS